MKKNKNILTRKNILMFSPFFLTVINLPFLYYLKYSNQDLPLNDFRISYIGNLIDLFFSAVLLIALIIFAFHKKTTYKPGIIFPYAIASTVLLILAALSDKILFPLPNIYILDHPLSKVITGFIYSAYIFIIFFQIMIIWQIIFGAFQLIRLRAFFNSTLLMICLLIFTFLYIHLNAGTNKLYEIKKGQLNVAVVLGAAVWSHNSVSPSHAARIDKAVELYKKGIVNKIQLTGGNTPGKLSEAEVAFDYIKPQKINPANIWMEKHTSSTIEQVKYIKDSLMTKYNISHILIVSDGYHLIRVREICRFFNIKTYLVASGLKLSLEHKLFYDLRESIALSVFWLFGI